MMLEQNSDPSGFPVQNGPPGPNDQSRREYESFFEKEVENRSDNQNLIQKMMRDSTMGYFPQTLHAQLKISVISHSLSFKVMILRAQINHFQFEVSVLNEEVNSRAHLFQKREFKYADIYSTVDQKPDFVVKCFRIKPEEDALNQFCTVLRQFCYYRIAAQLKIGPPIAHPFGFDLQVTDQCIEFALEKYEPIEKSKQLFNSNLAKSQSELRQKLYRLHSLHIVHKNIHPFNILYSAINKQFYLSDFGFCQQIMQPVGIQTKTAFCGALNYCHEQMIHVFDQRADSADLYLNDAYSLRQSFGYLKKSWQMQQKYKSEGRRVRVMELRDVYEDYGGLYNNMGSFYQRLDSVYQYAFSYYSLLKSLLAVHQKDAKILSNPYFIKVTEKFPFKISQILNDYLPCQFTKKLLFMVARHLQEISLTQSDRDEVYEIRNPFRRQLVQRRANIFEKTEAANAFEFCWSVNEGLSQLFSFQGGQHVRRAKIERKIVVNNPLLAVKLDNLTYYKQFVKFVDIRQIRSTYDEKTKACQGFLKAFKLSLRQNSNLSSQHPQLQKCLKHILYELINSPQLHSHTLIADTLTNLIISNTISDIDLFAVLEQLQHSKNHPLTEAVMLFNIYCGVDWIRFKALNVFEYKKVFQLSKTILYKALVSLQHVEPENKDLGQFIRLALNIFAADQQRILITQEAKQAMIGNIFYLEEKQAIDELTANQMISLTCLNAAASQGYYKEEDIVKAIQEIQTYRPKLCQDYRIESFHLRMYALLERVQSDDIHAFSIKNRFWRTLQVPKLLNKYKLFFSEERSKYNSEQIPRLVKSLQKLSAVKNYKYCKDVILEWRYWLSWLEKTKDEQLYNHYIIRLKEIYTNEELYNIDFPSISADNDFFSFYEHNFQLITFYLTLHRKEERMCVNILSNFLDQLESHYDAMNFQGSHEVKQVVVHFINFIKLEKYNLENKPKEANFIVREAVKSLTEENALPWSCAKVYLLQYMESVLKWASLYKNNQLKQKSFHKVFHTMNRLNLIQQIFSFTDALKFLLFLSWYALTALDHGIVNIFLHVHRQLLTAIDRDPIRPNIQSYIQSLEEIVASVLRDEKAIEIIQSILRGRVEKIYFDPGMDEDTQKLRLSNYDCLVLSSLLRYCSLRATFPEEITKHISLRIDTLVPQAKAIILDRLFTYRLVSFVDSQNKSEKRFIRRSWFQVRRYAKLVSIKDNVKKLITKQKELRPFKKKRYDPMVSRLKEYKEKWERQLQREDDQEAMQDSDEEETTQQVAPDL